VITTRAHATREELVQHVRARPFMPFALSLENGERVIVRHPENIAFDPDEGGSVYFYVIADKLRTFGTLDAISTISRLDRADI
jgi:hypothetical protein